MIILRLFLILVALALVWSVGMYVFNGDRRYLRFAGQAIRFSVILLLVFALLFVLERYVLAAWRVLL